MERTGSIAFFYRIHSDHHLEKPERSQASTKNCGNLLLLIFWHVETVICKEKREDKSHQMLTAKEKSNI